MHHYPGTTITGQRMYIPGTTNAHYKTRATVTVSQTKNLTNQMVQVSWTGSPRRASSPMTTPTPTTR